MSPPETSVLGKEESLPAGYCRVLIYWEEAWVPGPLWEEFFHSWAIQNPISSVSPVQAVSG